MNTETIEQLLEKITDLEGAMHQAVKKYQPLLQILPAAQKTSARNLIHYLCLRTEDIRNLQDQLHIYGLSSLASSESHILRQVQAIAERLGKNYPANKISKCDYHYSRRIMQSRADTLFGSGKKSTAPYFMVTFDKSFIQNYAFIKSLLQNGMQVARINCAHDDKSVWAQMIYLLKKASRKTGIPCKIYMDLAGPKIRTILTHKGKKEGKAEVREGDLIWLTEGDGKFSKKEVVIHPNESGVVGCLETGDRVFIDDGVIKGEVEQIADNAAAVRLVRVSAKIPVIKNGKGLNFPDSVLNVPALTSFDMQCLPFICRNADLVGYSFVRYASELETLQKLLSDISDNPPHIIVKIETPEAVQHLPSILLQGMHQKVFGVMIARGDLAVEIGFERMSEIQEEILWICEAAHAPVIWATQVLETLNKTGMATRSEITDAAHAAMAECIMINKGNYTIEVMETLREVTARMGGHHVKKRFTFRPLNIARRFFSET